MNYRETDPEFAAFLGHFALDEVVHEAGQQLDPVTRHMAIVATLIGCQGAAAFRMELPHALDSGLTPTMLKEIIYQAAAYLGVGRMLQFLDIANETLMARGVALPLEGQSTTDVDTRLEAGNQAQVEILAKRCAAFRTAGRRRAAISTAGWPPTVLGIITPAAAWITGSVR